MLVPRRKRFTAAFIGAFACLGTLGLIVPGGALAAAPAYTQAAHSGSYFGATSTASAGGGIYEDVPLSTGAGQLVCASAWVRTQFPAVGASGTFVIWLRGETTSVAGSAHYSGLGDLGAWSQVHTCAEATSAHNGMRIQFYPTPGGPTVDMDDVDVHESLAVNGGFENGGGPWAIFPGTKSNFSVYSGTAHSGSHYAATNTASAGGGIYEDVPLNTTDGQVVCGSAWVRTEGTATGASGELALWLIGDTTPEAGTARYSGLPNTTWTQIQGCVEATSPHTTLRIQFYPAVGSPTVEMDDVDVHESLAANGGFEFGGAPWGPYPNTKSNFSVYSGTAHSGSHYAATNTAGAGGGIYEDVPLGTTAGQLVCGSAWVRTEGTATGASGELALWLTGDTTHEVGTAGYSGLPNGTWSQIQGCVEATSPHNTLRIQFYPAVGSPTVEIDDVDVHESLAANGGFEYGSGPWSTYPGTNSTYDADPTGIVYGPAPPAVTTPAPPVTTPTPVVTKPVPLPLPRPKGRRALRIKISLSWTWRYQLTRLDKIAVGRMPGRTRLVFKCMGRGCPGYLDAKVTGFRRVRRLVSRLKARRFRAGDVLLFDLTAPGYTAEKAEIVIQYGNLPLARLLSR